MCETEDWYDKHGYYCAGPALTAMIREQVDMKHFPCNMQCISISSPHPLLDIIVLHMLIT